MASRTPSRKPTYISIKREVKEIFVPVTYVSASAMMEKAYGHPVARVDGAGEECAIELSVPIEFRDLISIELIWIGSENVASQHLSINCFWGKVGESMITHNVYGTDRDLGASVDNQLFAHDISDLIAITAPLEPGDFLGIACIYSAVAVDSNVRVLGVRFRYKSYQKVIQSL